MTLRIICFIILSAAMCLIQPTTGNVGNFCHGKPNGNYRDLYTCYGYIACSNKIAYKMRCPTGLMYNVEKDQCDYPENVECILQRTYGEDM
ncbi:hypothetical protein ABFA07_023461 [Porites harrisoni]